MFIFQVDHKVHTSPIHYISLPEILITKLVPQRFKMSPHQSFKIFITKLVPRSSKMSLNFHPYGRLK